MPLSVKQRVGLELQRALRHNEAQLHPLRTLFWECTLRCNLACRHCGSDCTQQSSVADMPAADFLHQIDLLTPHVDPHHLFIIFSGGEPLLRPDLEQVGLELYRREYPWGVVTNGFLLDAARLDSLLRSGLHSITISLDGFEAEHSWLRRNERSFQRATDAIRLLAEQRDIKWDVVSCITPRAYARLADFRDYLVGLGVRSWRLFAISPMGRASSNADLQLDDSQFRGLLDFIAASRRDDPRLHVSYACEGFLGHYEQTVRDHFFYCRSGIDVASLRCDGTISGCTSVRTPMGQGNIYEGDTLWDTWDQRFQLMRDRSWARKEQCADCHMWRYCEGGSLHHYDDHLHLQTCHYHRACP